MELFREATAQDAGLISHIYATSCKPGLPPRGLEFLRSIHDVVVKHTTPTLSKADEEASAHNSILCQNPFPVYAIGGIRFDPSQWQELAQHGATGACIMSAYMHI